MNKIKELKHDIATSLFLRPCTLKELLDRDFLKSKSEYGISIILNMLEKDGAVYWKGETIHTKKNWAKNNLKDRDLDFSTPREKYINGLTPFARKVLGL